ncbi:MAG: aspartate-semialdehyde dehydrogenase [Armatimonadetes bacterium]|nr:aspartate-semialdehyde dehydrogenase [Armatimonadota bacterium]
MIVLRVAVVGIGAVGREMVRCLWQSSLPLSEEPIVLARTAREVTIDGKTIQVREANPDAFKGADIVFFAGTEGEKGAAKQFARPAMEQGAIVIDNGSDFRMVEGVPLVVPEVNPDDLEVLRSKGTINLPGVGEVPQKYVANPNCSTIQMVVALKPLHDAAKIKRVIVSTYQAVSGAGSAAIEELEIQAHRILHAQDPGEFKVHPLQIAFNVLAGANWRFEEAGYTNEEWKMVRETRKILHEPELPITVTCVRVPVFNAHAEAIYVELEKPLIADEAREILRNAKGIFVIDEPTQLPDGSAYRSYPMPIDASGKDPVYVGRIRNDPFNPEGLWLWVVADNLRKGAALNAVQIAEEIVSREIVKP